MKVIAVILIAILTFNIAPSIERTTAESQEKSSETTEKRKQYNVPKQAKKVTKQDEKKPKKKITWRDNPNDCDLETQVVWKSDFSCHEKPSPVKRTSSPKQTNGGCGLVDRYDWNRRVAYAVCMGESTSNSTAENWRDNHGSCRGSFGLMQIACFWFPYYGYSLSAYKHNPEVNMKLAYKIYKRSGNSFHPWGAYTSGKYLKYLR